MKIIKKIIFSLMLIFIIITKISALSVDNNNVTYESGSTNKMELFANTSEKIKSISFSFTFSNYDVSARFIAKTGFRDNVTDNTKHTITFSEAQTGKIPIGDIEITIKQSPSVNNGLIRISNVTAVTLDDKTINLNNQTITVNIGELKPVDENLLSKIESSIVNINLEENKYEYDIEIDDSIEELDLNPVCKTDTCKVDVTSQKISELVHNQILITASDGNISKVYNINVKINKKQKELVLDDTEFKVDESYKKKLLVIIGVFSLGFIISLVFVFKNAKK